MLRLTYYVFNLMVALGPIAILLWRRREIAMNYRALLASYLLVSVPFILWDIWAASAGHWGFNPRFISGPYLWGIPVEEVLFFVTVPLAMLFVWEVVMLRFKEAVLPKMVSYIALAISMMLSTYLLAAHWGNGYTRSVGLVLLPTTLLLVWSKLLQSKRFLIFSGFHLMLFLMANSVLTALPVITYGDGSYIGYRIGTIPIEDFIFSYCLIGLSIWRYNLYHDRTEPTKGTLRRQT